MGNRRSFKTGSFDAVEATQGAVSAWYRNTTLSGNVSSVADLLDPLTPMVQTVDARRPAGNADGSMTFVGTAPDVLSVPITAANNADKFGWFWQIRTSTVAGGQANLITVRSGTAGASANRYSLRRDGANMIFLLYVDGTNGRTASNSGSPNVLTTGTANTIYCFFDKDAGAEADIFKVFIDGVQQTLSFGNIGVGAALSGGLTAGVTGNILFGNLNDGAASGAYDGTWSRNTYVLTEPLTESQVETLSNFEPLT